MSEVESTPDSIARTGFGALPSWLRIGIVAAATAVAVLIISVVIRIVLQTPVVPLGDIAADDLLPGSCMVQPGAEDVYTVVPCTQPHQQQIVASVDLAFPGVPYSADSSLATYAGYTCDRLLEYRLYLPTDLVKIEYIMSAISPPTLEQYNAGDTATLCAILDDPDLPEQGGTSDDLTRDLYRPIPQ
ncbi:MAG: septum formation family protein [Pseudolysinimonas sp.]